MDMKEFAEELRVEVEKKTGREVRIQQLTKNNGVVLYGINIIEPESNVTPIIYLESCYRRYEERGSMEEIAGHIYEVYIRNKISYHLDMGWFKDFGQVKDKVAYKLINYESNKDLLDNIPYERVLDLAKVYYVSLKTDELGEGTILVHNSHLELWGITAGQLKEYAEENTPKLFPAKIADMDGLLREMSGGKEMEEPWDSIAECNMYVVSNTKRVFGAAAMCYPGSIKAFAGKMKSDLYILPSSVHELIIMVPRDVEGIAALKRMVYEVNHTQLEEEEFLSDSVYIYRRETDTIEIA